MLVTTLSFTASALANDKEVRISIPKRTHATPVQRYNQEGVKALQKQHIDAARKFYANRDRKSTPNIGE